MSDFCRSESRILPLLQARDWQYSFRGSRGVWAAVRGLVADLPFVLDVEDKAANLGKSSLTDWVHAWLTEVERLTGCQVMIYTGADFARSYLGGSGGIGQTKSVALAGLIWIGVTK